MRGIVMEHVDKVVWGHSRSDRANKVQMGFPMGQISKSILAKGMADFSVGYSDPSGQTLSPDELVSLYCYSNMKGHFFTCSATFQEHLGAIEDLFRPNGRALVIDFGCGPATACLALADLLPNRLIDYVGIDTAPAMRMRAQKLWDAVKDGAGLIRAVSGAAFKPSWTDVPVERIPPCSSVMLVFSYFFASKSLKTQDLNGIAAWIANLANTRTGRPSLLFYMNSTDARANEKYDQLKGCLGLGGVQQPLQTKQIEFQTLKGGEHTSKCEFVSELLTLPVGLTAGTVPEENLVPF